MDKPKLNPVDLSYRDEHVDALLAENEQLRAEILRLRQQQGEAVSERKAIINIALNCEIALAGYPSAEAQEHYEGGRDDACDAIIREIRALPAASPPSPAVPEWPSVDEIAQEIRRVDGKNELGAGVLAEKIVAFLSASPASTERG
jgi:hypothetical protein